MNEANRVYHDTEWGIPVHDDRHMFEHLTLECLQCGLSWDLMLKKREIFRKCFDNFDYDRIAAYSEEYIDRILNTDGMIRSPRKVRAVIGVPFGQHPLGFMVVRNPKKNIEQYEPLQIACFVAMMMLEQKRRLAAERRFLISEGEEDDGKLRLRYNILGQHCMEIYGRTIREQDLDHPNRRGWLLLLYLVLHKKPVDIAMIARDLWPDEELAQVRNNNRQAIFRIHSEIAYNHDAKIIDTRAGAYVLANDIHLTTDAEEMEGLYERARRLPDTVEKLESLEKAFSLYRGRLFQAGETELGSWAIPFSTHYSQIFVDVTKELLAIQDTLGHQDISTTMNIYADVTKELKKSEFEGLDTFFKTGQNRHN